MDEIVAWADKLEQPAIRRLGELPSHADQHPNRYPCRRFPFDRLAFTGPLPDNQTLELRTDLVGANQNDAWAGIQFLWSPELQGYALFKDQDEVALVKFWNGATSLAWFFYENRPLKNQNVTLVLALTRVGSDLRINTRVLDKDNANAVLFERTVTDTPQADPVLPNPPSGVIGMPDLAGTPWPVVKAPTEVELTLTWVNPQSSSQGGAEVISDNLDVWQYESPSPNVVAWGSNRYGQTNVPAGLTNVVAVAGGAGHTLALRADGTVVAWGNDDFGKINVPAGLTNVVAIDAGGFRGFGGNEGGSLALRADGTMVAWGGTYGGSPGALAGWTNVVAVAAGGDTSLALRADGTVIAWGNNDFGKADVPAGLSNVVAVAAGGWHSLALRSDGTVVAWGAGLTNSGSWPDLGQSIDPAGLTNAVGVSAGLDYSLALRADGTAVAWGQYWGGSPEVPMTVPDGLTNLVAVAAGFWHSLALLGDGPPVVKASLSHPTLSASGFSVSLPTQSGRVFALEYKDSLTDAAWTPLPLVAGTGHERTLTDPTAAGTQRFYRVRRW